MARIYQPLQRQSDGRWDYTVSSDDDGWTHAIGYCRGPFKRLMPDGVLREQECARWNAQHEPFAHKWHAGGHATALEAEACYRDYQLDHELRFDDERPDPDTLRRCAVPDCGTYTSGEAEFGHVQRWWPLCGVHRTREAVARLLEPGPAPGPALA